MTTAEKLLRAKTDIDEVHEAGYNKGYNQCTEDMQDDLQEKYTKGYETGYRDGKDDTYEDAYAEGAEISVAPLLDQDTNSPTADIAGLAHYSTSIYGSTSFYVFDDIAEVYPSSDMSYTPFIIAVNNAHPSLYLSVYFECRVEIEGEPYDTSERITVAPLTVTSAEFTYPMFDLYQQSGAWEIKEMLVRFDTYER